MRAQQLRRPGYRHRSPRLGKRALLRAASRDAGAAISIDAIFASAGVGLCLCDPHDRIVKVNQGWRDAFGIQALDLFGEGMWDLFPDVGSGGAQSFARARESGPLEIPRIALGPGGGAEEIWFACHIAPVPRPDGIYVLVTVWNVTIATSEDSVRRTSREHLHDVFDRLREGYLLIDYEWRYVYVNEAVVQQARLPRSLLVGRTMMQAFPGFETTQLHHKLAQCMRDRAPARFEDEFTRPDGTTAWFDLIVQPQPEGLFILSIDITERKLAQRAREDSDERFRQLSETIDEVFWLTDVEKGTMLYLSPGYERVWGRTRKALYESPHDWLDAIHPDDRARVHHAALTKQIDGTYDEEYRIVRPDGAVRWIRDRGYPVRDADGKVVRLAGAAQDVTDRRALENQLHHTQKMESIGIFAGGIAHDFNNLLTVISSNCYDLQEITPPEGEIAELLGEINEAGERAAALTRQLLAFSRREVTASCVVDLVSIVVDAEKMLRRILGEDVILATTFDPRSSRVEVDPGGWMQILMNLAINARDAMPRGGKLSIATGRTQLGEDFVRSRPHLSVGPHVTLTVTDSGTGMSPEVTARIFEPFFTTKEVGSGTGLGLAVVHGIVSQSGGHIEVASTEGVGTTFRMYLPAVTDETRLTEVQARRRAGAATGGETILVVEDEDRIRRIATRALAKMGYAVLQAPDGERALAVANDHPATIDLLLTDVVMPRMDGRELAEALTAKHRNMRVVYTSGYTDDTIVRRGIQQAEVAFLRKPYDPMVLRQKIREVLDARVTCHTP